MQIQHHQMLLQIDHVQENGIIDELDVKFLILDIDSCLEKDLLLVVKVFQNFYGFTKHERKLFRRLGNTDMGKILSVFVC